jgi:hypothetical protein
MQASATPSKAQEKAQKVFLPYSKYLLITA